MDRILLHFSRSFHPTMRPSSGDGDAAADMFDLFEEDAEHPRPRKQRCSNRFGYSFHSFS
jgi:hypothetical protein